jgi:hypothetical protein
MIGDPVGDKVWGKEEGKDEEGDGCGCAESTGVVAAVPALGATALVLESVWAASGEATPAKIDSVSAVRNRVNE